jgi:hypothetical protein
MVQTETNNEVLQMQFEKQFDVTSSEDEVTSNWILCLSFRAS